MIGPTIGFSGRYKLTRFYGESNIILEEIPWFDNLITDRGLDLLGYGHNATCYVGSNLTSLDPSICAITGVLGSSSSVVAAGLEIQNTVLPYYGIATNTYDFAVGSVVGTIREIGIGNSATDLFSRAYLTDSQGQQTTLTCGTMDRLQLTYEFRVYPPTTQFNVSFDVNGTTHSGIGNSAWVAIIDSFSSTGWSIRPGTAIGAIDSAFGVSNYYGDILFANATNLGLVTGNPNGTPVGIQLEWTSPGSSVAAYVPGSYKRTITMTWGIGYNALNVTGLLHGLLTRNPFGLTKRCSTGMWQMLISPAINKTYYQHMTLSYEVHWARYTP